MAAGYWLKRLAPHLDVLVLEADDVPGGKVRTLSEDGYLVDTGPGTLILGNRWTDELVEDLGLSTQVHESAAVTQRFLVKRGRLVPLPGRPAEALRTPLVSIPGKLRVLLEPFVPRGDQDDESVHAFLARRFGAEVAKTFGEAMVSGIVAGDPRQISVGAVMPQLPALERRHGSVLRGMVAARKTAGGPRRRTVALAGGMGTLIGALARSFGGALRTGCRVESLTRSRDAYLARTADGSTIVAASVVLATPAYVSARLLENISEELASQLSRIAYVSVDVIALGYRTADVPRPLGGFGFLAPRNEGVRSLGVMNASALSSDAAPSGHVLFRAIAGGDLDPEFTSLSDAKKVEAVQRDLEKTLGISARPAFERVISWSHAIPQYTVGHTDRVRRIEAGLAEHPALSLLGNAYRGVGVADCLREAKGLAEGIVGGVAGTRKAGTERSVVRRSPTYSARV